MTSLMPIKRETRDIKKPVKLSRKKLEKALEEEREKGNEYLTRLKYLQADFENYRKRTEKKTDEIAKFVNERLIVNLLSVIDEMELAVKVGKQTKDKEALIKGVEIILKKMYTTLTHEGLTKIEVIGERFDPKMHEVVMKVPTKKYDEGVVIEEVRKGFMLREKVIRPSIVKIATKKDVNS